MTDFIEKLAEQFDDVDAGLLTTETKFHELDDYTSLVALMIISMIDEEYNAFPWKMQRYMVCRKHWMTC